MIRSFYPFPFSLPISPPNSFPISYRFWFLNLVTSFFFTFVPPPMAPRFFFCFGRGASSSHRPSSAVDDDSAAAAEADASGRGGPVLVELFSSQGCGSSPEAEMVATRLGRGDLAVAVLAFHVEYWDYRGWKDPFGSSLWTVRQKAYVESLRLDTLYTPQVVLHGRKDCLGTDEEAIVAAVRAAPRFPSPTMQATFSKPSPTTLQVSLAGALRTKVDSGGVDVMVALFESSLVTDCASGENKGRMLTNNHVVRRLEKMATVRDIAAKKSLTGSVQFDLWDGFNAAKCGIILFVQNASFQTFGTQQFRIPDTI